MKTRLILDTDMGTDVDDCLALAVILGSPELQLEGVTCVYGDVTLRARMTLKLLKLADRVDVPVMVGSEQTLLGRREIYWPGHEGQGLLEPEDAALVPGEEHAVDYLVRAITENPGEIHLLAIGPLTNVALALRRAPEIARLVSGLTIMGGVQRTWDSLDLPFAEHNIMCDPEAAHVVMASGAPITLVPLDVTTRVSIRQDGVDTIRGANTPFHEAVARQVELYPRFVDSGSTFLHDPLAAALVVEPRLADTAALRVVVETEGLHGSGMTLMKFPSAELPATANVARGVDVSAAEKFIIDRIVDAARHGAGERGSALGTGARPGFNPARLG